MKIIEIYNLFSTSYIHVQGAQKLDIYKVTEGFRQSFRAILKSIFKIHY